MSRYLIEFQSSKTKAEIGQILDTYFANEGFKPIEYKGEHVYKKGIGLLTAPQYLLVEYGDNAVKIQAWIKNALLPGVYVGEMGLKGFVGAVPKAALRSKVDYLVKILL